MDSSYDYSGRPAVVLLVVKGWQVFGHLQKAKEMESLVISSPKLELLIVGLKRFLVAIGIGLSKGLPGSHRPASGHPSLSPIS